MAAIVQQRQYDHFYVGRESIHRWLMDGGIFPESNDDKLYGPFVIRRQEQQSKRVDETTTHDNSNSHEEA